jgi:hypothetical protein
LITLHGSETEPTLHTSRGINRSIQIALSTVSRLQTINTWSQSSWGCNFYCKAEKYKSPVSDQISAEMYQAGGETLVSVTHKLITSIWNTEEMPDQWKESIIVPIHKTGDKTDCIIIVGYHCYQLHTTFYKTSFFHG